MKRIAVCMDGTWQKLSQSRATNIAIIARSIAHSREEETARGLQKVQQIVVYSRGVGALSELDSEGSGLAGGLFGAGLEDNIIEAYIRLAFNYEPEDEIYIFGFSRGAFSARSLAAMIAKVGIVSRRFVEAAPDAFQLYRNKDASAAQVERFRTRFGKRLRRPGAPDTYYPTTIRYLGVFDTVGQRGMPSAFGPISDWINRKYAFHDTALRAGIEAARHAVAIDEDRWVFPPAPWSNFEELNAAYGFDPGSDEATFQQRWFPGGHGDVGGGGSPELSGYPLSWIVEGAERAGLKFDRTKGSKLSQALAALDYTAPLTTPRGFKRLKPMNWSFTNRSIEARGLGSAITPDVALRYVHPAAAARIAGKKYRPATLRRFTAALLKAETAIAAARAMRKGTGEG